MEDKRYAIDKTIKYAQDKMLLLISTIYNPN